MSSYFYGKLAFTNIKKNSQTYLPYILTCIGTILMFYNAYALTIHTVMHGSVQQMMYLGSIVTGLFSAIFLFYTNSFLMKRRKKEFGLYEILGMEKKHIGKVMLWENLYVAVFSIVSGITLGILLSKLITLILYRLLGFNPNVPFEISGKSIAVTSILFFMIFLSIYVNSIVQIHGTQPVELLKGGNVGEKEPKTNWLITLIGLISLATGYIISIIIRNPLNAIFVFLGAVILVIIGTYCLFTSGSIALLKSLKKNKKYYYQTKNFTTVSGMLYRMKQNAVGLANICIMSTAVLVMVSTTVSMYVGVDDLLTNRFPSDFSLYTQFTPENDSQSILLKQTVNLFFHERRKNIKDVSSMHYSYFSTLRSGSDYNPRDVNRIESDENYTMLLVMTAEEYEKNTGISLSLADHEAAVYSERESESISAFGHRFKVAKQLDQKPVINDTGAWFVDLVYLVVPGEKQYNAIYYAQKQAYGEKANDQHFELAFNLDMPEDEKEAFASMLVNHLSGTLTDIKWAYDSKQLKQAVFLQNYGGLLFLGIFFGTLFLMATVLIIYFKQVVEGYEDKERFIIMKKVGMSYDEIKKTINTQVLTVFALPILAAVTHIVVAFPILTTLLALLNLTNITLFGVCTVFTVIIFMVIYVIVFKLTSRVYLKIINQ